MKRADPFGALSLLVLAGGILIFGTSLTAMPERTFLWDELPEPRPVRSAIFDPPSPHVTLTMGVSAYTSSPEETDDTPFITASNTRVRDGIVATNHLPFGSRVQIPEYFGSKIFVVEDSMHERFVDTIDIWMGVGPHAKLRAKQFGRKTGTAVVVLNSLATFPHNTE